MSKSVKRLAVPRYFHVTEGGHDWYVQSWSDFKGPGSWAIYCEECEDYHGGKLIDPLTMPERVRKAYTDKTMRESPS